MIYMFKYYPLNGLGDDIMNELVKVVVENTTFYGISELYKANQRRLG